MESGRVDALFLLNENTPVIEPKSKTYSVDAEIDRAFGHARVFGIIIVMVMIGK